MIAILCPGQGAQTAGFLAPWLELPDASDRLGTFSEAIGVDLIAHGTTSTEETIKDTAIAQPLIVAAGLLAYAALTDPVPGLFAGHSVGEITAAAAAGVLTETDALTFVRIRARGMAAASELTPTGMGAVLGGSEDEVLDRLAELDLTPANRNGAGQIVAAGPLDRLAELVATPPARARVIPLKVAGAFHTGYMASAVEELSRFADTLSPSSARSPLLSNADGAAISDGPDVLARLVAQVTSPVRWDRCMATLLDLGVTGVIELAPAGTLVGLAKRAMKGVPSVALNSPADLDAAIQLLADHPLDSRGGME